MKGENYSISIIIDRSPKEVFDAINNVRGWFSEAIEGETDKPDAEFRYRYRDAHRCTMKITEIVDDKKIVWRVIDNYFSFVKDQSEWIGTDIVFEISPRDRGAKVRFTHDGLVPSCECYEVCAKAWERAITVSLRELIMLGRGRPHLLVENNEPEIQLSNHSLHEEETMEGKSYTATILVDRSPKEAYDAITNVRGWWSEAIEGETDKPGAVFLYHYRDVHRCTMKITELVPEKKVVWHVLDNYFNFIKDETEWIGTDVIFEISRKGGKTEIRFTHVGLVPAYECYDVCSNAWSSYITTSLRDLIVTGKGKPNPMEEDLDQERRTNEQGYTTSFTVDKSPEEAFDAINNVRGWWSGDFEGDAGRLGAEFTYRYHDVHYSKQKVTEFRPGKRIVWHVTDANLTFTKDTREWVGTDIIFDITRQGERTEVRFTHAGLVPAFECYDDCSNAWGMLVNANLHNLIATGKNQPNPFEVHA